MFIDTHAHLTSEQLLPHLPLLLERGAAAGVEAIVNICTDAQSLQEGIALHRQFPWVYTAAATTPHDVQEQADPFFPLVEEAALKGELIALGETGLDYFYPQANVQAQHAYLLRYFTLATRCKLPLIFHCREAFEDLFALCDAHYAELPALLHCFTGSLKEAQGVLDRGWMLSLSGIVTFTKSASLREVAAYVPLDRLVIETDAPYLAPQSQRGKLNEPAFVVEVARTLALVKGLSIDEVARMTTQNARRFFSLSKMDGGVKPIL